MTTQEVGCFRGDCFEHILRLNVSDFHFDCLLRSRVNSAVVPESAPIDVELNYKGRQVRDGKFSYKKKYPNSKIPPVVVRNIPAEFEVYLLDAIEGDRVYDNQTATLRILRNISEYPDNRDYENIILESDRMYSEALASTYFLDISRISKGTSAVFKNAQIFLDFLRTAYAKNTPSTGFGERFVKGPYEACYIYSRDLYLFSMFGEVYAFTDGGLSVCIDCVDMFTKMANVFTDSYPDSDSEANLIAYHNMILDEASNIDIVLTPIIGYIVHQAVSAAILEEHGIDRSIASSFFAEAEEKVSDYMKAFGIKYKKGMAADATGRIFDWIFNLSKDRPFIYELSLVFRAYPAPDMSKAHILETCYNRTSKEHPYCIPDKEEYMAYCRREIYRAYRRAKESSISARSSNVNIANYIREGKDPLLLDLEGWKHINLVGSIEVPEVNSDPFSLAKDSAIPYEGQEMFSKELGSPTIEHRNYLLHMAHDNEYHSCTLKSHMEKVLSGEKKINCNILQRVKFENVKLPNSPRVFSEAPTDLRLTIAGLEHIGRRILRLLPGNAMGKTPEDFLNYVYKMSLAGQATGSLTYVSYDLSKFGTRYNTELLKSFLEIINEISPVKGLPNITRLLHSGHIFIDEGEITGKYYFRTGNCEGFFNAIWTLEHIMTMSYAAYKASQSGLIIGNIFLLTFSDDGASAQHVDDPNPKRAVARLAEHLGKWYNSMGKSFNPVKGMINTTGFNFLNYLVAYGRVFPSGMKTVSRIKVKQNDYLQGFHEDVGSMVSAARGAVVRGADPFSAYRMLIIVANLYMSRYLDGYSKASYKDKKYFLYFPKSHYGAGFLDVIELIGTLIKDREVDGMELCRHMADVSNDCDYLATMTLPPAEKNLRTIIANPRSVNRKGIHAYLPLVHKNLRDAIKYSFLCDSIKAYAYADIDVEPYLNWVPESGAIPVRILEEYWEATPSAVLSAFLGKLRNRHSYLALIEYRDLIRMRKSVTYYRKKKFQGFLNKRTIGSIEGSSYDVVHSMRLKANKGLVVEGATEPSVYRLISIEPGHKSNDNVTVICDMTNGVLIDDLSKDYMKSGLYYKLGRSIKNSLSTETNDPYLPIEAFDEVRGNLATAARALRRVSASVCLEQESRSALIMSLADWWGYEGSHIVQDTGHNFDYNQFKRYCISSMNLSSSVSLLPNITCATHTTFPDMTNLDTNIDELIDHGRARILMAGVFAALISKRIKLGLIAKISSNCIYNIDISRKINLDLLKGTKITYRRAPSYTLLPFNPFDVEMSYKNFFDPAMRKHIGRREMVPLAMCIGPSEDAGGIIIEYKTRTGMLAPIAGTSIRADNRPVLAASALMCYSPRAAYDWNMKDPPTNELPSIQTLTAYFQKAIPEYTNADTVEFLKDYLKGDDIPYLLAKWTLSEGITSSWDSVLNWIRTGRHGFLRDARSYQEAIHNLAHAGRVVYDLVGIVREMVRLICSTLKVDPRNEESRNATKYGHNELLAVARVKDRHEHMKMFQKRINRRNARLAIFSILDEACYIYSKNSYRVHGFVESPIYAIRKASRVASSVVARFIKPNDIEIIKARANRQVSDFISYHATKKILELCTSHALDWFTQGKSFFTVKEAESIIEESRRYTENVIEEMFPRTCDECVSSSTKALVFECGVGIDVNTKELKGLCSRLGDRANVNVNCIARDIVVFKDVYKSYLFDDLVNTKFHVGDATILAPSNRRIAETEDSFRWNNIANILTACFEADLITVEDISAAKRRILKLTDERVNSVDENLGLFISRNPLESMDPNMVYMLYGKILAVADEASKGIIRH